MLCGMGRKTSVWLPDDLAERVRESGVPLAELIRRGLEAGQPAAVFEVVRSAVRAELGEWLKPPLPSPRGASSADEVPPGGESPVLRRARDVEAPPRCSHAGVRVTGGWCAQCQSDVKPGGLLVNRAPAEGV